MHDKIWDKKRKIIKCVNLDLGYHVKEKYFTIKTLSKNSFKIVLFFFPTVLTEET